MLTGRCKIDFEKWFIEDDKDNPIKSWVSEDFGLVYLQTPFSSLPISFKWGVYQQFFDQYADDLYPDNKDIIGYDLVVFKWRNKYVSNVYEIDGDKIGDDVTIGKDKGYKTRELARLNVIKHANSIYNENISNTSI